MASNTLSSCLIDVSFDMDEALTLQPNFGHQIAESDSLVADLPTVSTDDDVCSVCMERFQSGYLCRGIIQGHRLKDVHGRVVLDVVALEETYSESFFRIHHPVVHLMATVSNTFSSCIIDVSFDMDEALTLPSNFAHQISESESLVDDMLTVVSDDVCSVCMEGFQSGVGGKRVPCGHVYHAVVSPPGYLTATLASVPV
ncbi:hypothetical protein GH714_039047 [Hevea brasiliensis]|uniref:RING-type domain-containing protein n=1 Tax=Hevea brasiliensis TaxID=3981 RepID=A0A6A6K9Y5_HEVBR|nr:hypothetical protein GH714_039047 [Hevea brasiliensis]